MRRLQSPRGSPLSLSPPLLLTPWLFVCAFHLWGQGLCLQSYHLCGSPFLSLSPVSVFISPCALSVSITVSVRLFLSLSVHFPLCVSPTTFSPLGCLSPSLILCRSGFLSLCLPDFLWFLSLTLLPCFSLSPLPPIPFSSPPSTSLICQVSRDTKGGQACRAVRAWEAARPRAYSQRTEAGGRTPVPWEGSHLPLKASTLHTPC